jgi:hypothetical protein
MKPTPIGNCRTDNQGNPVPPVGGLCDLGASFIDASVIDTPDPESVFGGGMINNGRLDDEFYQIDPRQSAGASPASQNDFYGNMYSLADFNYDQPMRQEPVMEVEQSVVLEKPCGCNGNSASHKAHNGKVLMGIVIIGLILIALNK